MKKLPYVVLALVFFSPVFCFSKEASWENIVPFKANNQPIERQKAREDMMCAVDDLWNRKNRNQDVASSTFSVPQIDVLQRLKGIVIPKINFSDMPLSRVIEVLSELSTQLDDEKEGVNMVLIDPEGLNPKVSINLRNASLEKALGFVSKCSQFSYDIREDTVIFEYIPGSSLSLETAFFPLSRGTVVRLTDMQQKGESTKDGQRTKRPSTLEEEKALKIFFQKAGVDFEHVPGSSLAFEGTQLIITHTPRNLERVHTILNRYKDVKQVEIEAKFLEVQEGVLEELGFRWGGSKGSKFVGTGSKGVDNLRSLNQAFATQSSTSREGGIVVDGTAVAIAGSTPNIPNTLNLASVAGPVASITGTLKGWDLSSIIRALEQHGGADLMSAPKLTVLSGKTAQITVAQEFRYPESFGDIGSGVGSTNLNGGGSAGVSITAGTPRNFVVRNIGVEMEVTPTVEENSDISLKLEPKVTEFEGFIEYGGSSIAVTGNTSVNVPSGFIQPIFSTRKIMTELTIANGETAVLGGLAREEVLKVHDKVPILGDIPILGRLFRSRGETSQKKNLLIFVRASLISTGGQI